MQNNNNNNNKNTFYSSPNKLKILYDTLMNFNLNQITQNKRNQAKRSTLLIDLYTYIEHKPLIRAQAHSIFQSIP